ncbi:Protein tyrosine kinase Protein kinase domain [Trypanosoma vivax]|nr:protein kinase [Trypanosoma vivax]KAH8609574.1 Protein tyrosine kinase Protein kinase domain [Trypanosoma vivax]
MKPSDTREVVGGFISIPNVPKSNWKASDFDFICKLGSGNYGDVSLASVRGCNFLCAIKQLSIERLASLDITTQLRREIEIAFHTRHKYLLRTYAYFYDEKYIYLILEPCSNGMLYTELRRVKVFPPATAARYVAQLAEALLYLHQHNILHRDIKPENILLDHKRNIKLADFGWSVHDPNNRRVTSCGTPEYFPPEIIRRQAYDASIDLWCLGIFCYELLVGRTPFVESDTKNICMRIHSMQFTIPDNIPAEARDLIKNLLLREGSKRLPLHRVVNHPFLMKYYYIPNNIQPPVSKRRRAEAEVSQGKEN